MPGRTRGIQPQRLCWHFYLPDELKFRASNNLLKHLAPIIMPWIDIIAGRLKKDDCALSMTDSTTSEGWLRKSNFIEDGEDPIQATIRLEVARLNATHYLSTGIREYSQWFCGADNNVADALPLDKDRTDDELTQILRSHCPSQLPQHFKIVPLPNKIASWLTLLLLPLPVKQQLVETHSTTKLGCGIATQSTAAASDSETISSSRTCPKHTESKSSEVSPWLYIKDDYWEENFCKVDSFGRGYSVFRSLFTEVELTGNWVFKFYATTSTWERTHCFLLPTAKIDCIELAIPSLRQK